MAQHKDGIKKMLMPAAESRNPSSRAATGRRGDDEARASGESDFWAANIRLFLATSLFATLAAGALAQPAPSISVSDAWSRATGSLAQAGAVYATITDHGTPDRLIAASTPVAGVAGLHETVRDGDVMKMRAVPSLAISPDAPILLAPGGYHIMLTQLKQPLTSGQTFPLTLTFEKAGTIETTVTVKPLGAGGGMNMGGAGHDMQHMDMPGMTKP